MGFGNMHLFKNIVFYFMWATFAVIVLQTWLNAKAGRPRAFFIPVGFFLLAVSITLQKIGGWNTVFPWSDIAAVVDLAGCIVLLTGLRRYWNTRSR